MNNTHTILIVDDQKDNLLTIATYIEEAPSEYHILSALNAVKALELTHKFIPDLIISDWDMPSMSGMEFIQELKKSLITKNIPIIIVTGVHLSPEDLKFAFDLGAIEYIRKPIHKLELWARINSILSLIESHKIINNQMLLIAQQKDQELGIRALETYHKNKKLAEVQIAIKEILPETKENTGIFRSLKKVVDAIQSCIDAGDEWHKFRKYFDAVHPDFFSGLQLKYPELTIEDLKYCGYVKIHMSNKEIADLLNINVESVRTHKYRLKIKMALPAEINLHDFIIAL